MLMIGCDGDDQEGIIGMREGWLEDDGEGDDEEGGGDGKKGKQRKRLSEREMKEEEQRKRVGAGPPLLVLQSNRCPFPASVRSRD